MEIFPLEYGFGDFFFEKWRFFLSKICLWRFFLEDLFWRLFHWKFLRRFVHGDFSFGIWFWKSFLWKMEIFPWRFILRDFSIEVLKIFKKIWSWRFFLWNMVLEIFPLKNGDFSFWRFVRGDFSLKIYSRDFLLNFWKFLRRFVHGDFSFVIWFWRFFFRKMEIFPFEDLFIENFP